MWKILNENKRNKINTENRVCGKKKLNQQVKKELCAENSISNNEMRWIFVMLQALINYYNINYYWEYLRNKYKIKEMI